MITTPTTFVIGAGGSVPYQFPSGASLIQSARALAPSSPLYQVLVTPGGSKIDELNNFLVQLRNHPASSIDAFLDTRRDLSDLGKRVIATLMGHAAKHAADWRTKRQPDADEDWLALVLEEMWSGAPSFEEFLENKVTFVTFNFDLNIEETVSRSVAAIYKNADPAAALRQFPVLHVHGRLPTNLDALNTDWIAKAANELLVVHERLVHADVALARAAIADARVVCFLGFSYHIENIKRLEIPSVTQAISKAKRPRIEWFGSAYMLPDGERTRIERRFGRSARQNQMELGDSRHTCKQFLLASRVFRD